MNLTSILVVINDQTTDISNIQDNVKYAGSKVQILVFNNFCDNAKVIDGLKPISTIWLDNHTPFIKTFSECINELLRICQTDYICISREDSLLSENWLKALIDKYNLIESSGVVSVNDLSTSDGTYQLTKYNTLEWVYSSKFRINNFAFFRTELIYKIGGFNPDLNGVYAFWDFCERAMKKGFYNYFVPETNMIRQNQYTDHFGDDDITPHPEKKKDEFVKIFNLSQKDENNLVELSSKLGSLFAYNDKLGCIVFSKKNELNFNTISSLSTELKNLNMELELYCSSYFENDILKMSFIGLIRESK
jgi:hypothetical protein